MVGAILVDKPAGPSSFKVVSLIRKRFGFRRVGHCGTLDPLASGLLVLLVDEGTKFQRYIQFDRKGYSGRIQLGILTSTLDLEGERVLEAPVPKLTQAILDEVAGSFLGTHLQAPPRFSAVKIGGERAYRRARQGEEFDPSAREVTLESLSLTLRAPDLLEYRLKCSTGFYVRSFARDLAERLGTVGIAAEIRRNAVGPVTVEDALPLDQLIQNDADPPICPVERLLSLPTARIRNEDYQELMLGRRPLIPELPEGESMLINPGGEICGVVSRDSTGGFTVRFMVNLLPT